MYFRTAECYLQLHRGELRIALSVTEFSACVLRRKLSLLLREYSLDLWSLRKFLFGQTFTESSEDEIKPKFCFIMFVFVDKLHASSAEKLLINRSSVTAACPQVHSQFCNFCASEVSATQDGS